MNKLYINLLNFNNNKLGGTGYFFKRIISEINFDEPDWKKIDSIVVFGNTKIDPIELFEFNKSNKIRVVKLIGSNNFLIRILLEQLFLPLYLLRSTGIFFSPTPAVPLISRFINKKLIIIPSIHDMIPFYVKEKYSYTRGLYIKFISKCAAKCANKIITVSEHSKHDIAKIANVDTSKITVIYNFVPKTTFYNANTNNKYFLTVCTIEPGKNLENMIKGFSIFLKGQDSNHDYKYKIVGQLGWNYQSIFSLAKELNLDKSIEFVGYVDDETKNNYIKNCIGMIYLSKYEGFGIPPLEAMYYNKVSIVSNTSSLPEVVGDAGIIQSPSDTQLLANNLEVLSNDAEKYKANIPKQLKKFDPHLQIENFKSLIIYCLA